MKRMKESRLKDQASALFYDDLIRELRREFVFLAEKDQKLYQ